MTSPAQVCLTGDKTQTTSLGNIFFYLSLCFFSPFLLPPDYLMQKLTEEKNLRNTEKKMIDEEVACVWEGKEDGKAYRGDEEKYYYLEIHLARPQHTSNYFLTKFDDI